MPPTHARGLNSSELSQADLAQLGSEGTNALPSPRPPFSLSRSGRSSPRIDTSVGFYTSGSSSSLQLLPPASPAPSATPSDSSRRGFLAKRHRATASTSPPPSGHHSSLSFNREETPRQHVGRSVSDTLPPIEPKLQRKKSSASLLYRGIGRGLSRVGSVMRRNTAPVPEAPSTPSSTNTFNSTLPRRQPRRNASSTLQNLFEETEQDNWLAPPSSPPPVRPTPRPSIYVPSRPPEESDLGVSVPFNVQHELHVTADLDGLPPEWLDSLKAQGVTEQDLLLITSAQMRQRRVSRVPIVRTHTPIDMTRTPSPERMSPKITTSKTLSPPKRIDSLAAVATPVPRPARMPSVESFARRSPDSTAEPILRQLSPRPRTTSSSDISTVSRSLDPSPATVHSAKFASPLRTPPRTPQSKLSTSPTRTSQAQVAASPVPTPRPATGSSALTPSRRQPSGGSVQRSSSILGKLLTDLDARSIHARARPQTSLPAHAEQDTDTESTQTRSRASSVSSSVLARRMSDELRGFRDMELGEDGWAASILAAWDGDNTVTRDFLAHHRNSFRPHPLAGLGLGPSVASNQAQNPTPPSPTPSRTPSESRPPSPRPRSVHSLGAPADDSSSISSYSVRMCRRSRSFDSRDARQILHSPPPPPRQKRPPTAGLQPNSRTERVDALRLRVSVDSFGVSRSRHTPTSATSVGSMVSTAPPTGNSSSFHHSTQSPAHSSSSSHSGHLMSQQASQSPSSSEVDLSTPPNNSSHSKRPLSVPPAAKSEELARKHFSFTAGSELVAFTVRPLVQARREDGIVPLTAAALASHSGRLAPTPPTEGVTGEADGPGFGQECTGCVNSGGTSSGALGLSLMIEEHSCKRSISGRSRSSSCEGATLSRMSSIASSTHSYYHEVTVQRAYTRVLRRVAEQSEVGDARSETDRSDST